MKLEQIGEKTYYIANDTNIGIYMTGPNRVCLIDTGSKGDGQGIDEIISDCGWQPDFIINTHSHIDHIGGNKYLMEKYGITAYCTELDMAFANYADLEAYYMNGGRPASKLRHIFTHPGKIGFRAIEEVSEVCPEAFEAVTLAGIRWKLLPGHTFGMIGVKTPDDVWFLGDSYLSEAYMAKRRFGYLVDAGAYLDTIEMLRSFEGSMFVPSHGVAEENISEILDMNVENQQTMIEAVRGACKGGSSLDSIVGEMYRFTKLRNNEANHALLTSTVKCYLTYLQDKGELQSSFENDIMIWG